MPCAIILTCSAIVCIEMKKLVHTRPSMRSCGPGTSNGAVVLNVIQLREEDLNKGRDARVAEEPADVVDHHQTGTIAGKSSNGYTDTKPADDKIIPKECIGNVFSIARHNMEHPTTPTLAKLTRGSTMNSRSPADANRKQVMSPTQSVSHVSMSREERERRTFVTLAYIVITYVICWVPFHIVYDLSFIYPNIVSNSAFTYTFWMTYLNSTVNPFIYAFTSRDLRDAIKKVILCRWSIRN